MRKISMSYLLFGAAMVVAAFTTTSDVNAAAAGLDDRGALRRQPSPIEEFREYFENSFPAFADHGPVGKEEEFYSTLDYFYQQVPLRDQGGIQQFLRTRLDTQAREYAQAFLTKLGPAAAARPAAPFIIDEKVSRTSSQASSGGDRHSSWSRRANRSFQASIQVSGDCDNMSPEARKLLQALTDSVLKKP